MIMHRILVLGCCIGLAACSSVMGPQNPQVVAAPDPVSAMLAGAADKASNALQSLAAVEQAKNPTPSLARISNAPPELNRAVTVSWVGPVDAIVRTLSDRASYAFDVFGDAPPVPVVVNLDVENKPVIEILRDIGLQLGGRANLRVDSNRRVIELHYAPVTSS
jgi:defect-in-organelle-trafficking protein DotD